MRPAKLALLALVLSTAPGCGACRRMAGEDTISLEKAEVKSMSVDLRRQQKTVCPRASVQMGVFAEIVLDGKPQQVETWVGQGAVNKNDKLDFTEFAFHSEQGAFDGQGWFKPHPDLLATVGREFEIKTVYRRRPDKFSFTTTYKPDYACVTNGGKAGGAGHPGGDGSAGLPGKAGQGGSASQAGGPGGDAGNGTEGGRGSDGGPGPYLQVYATMVKTPFYPRLLAVMIEGDASDFLLVPDGQPVTIHANGGAGGPGGHGGAGGTGGAGGSGNPPGAGGRGGTGGSGGQGGNGGGGGAIELTYDPRFPEAKAQITLDVAGGTSGPGGAGGASGAAGSGGGGMTPPSAPGKTSPSVSNGPGGSAGSQGSSGVGGGRGQDGRTSVKTGEVHVKLPQRPEVTPL